MLKKLSEAFERISLRTKLTALTVALIGVLLAVSSLGTGAVLRTYLQQSQDAVLNAAATTLKSEDPTLIQTRLALRQVQLPNLPTDYFIAFLNPDGSIIIGLSASTNPTATPPNVTSLTLPAVALTRGLPFEVDRQGKFTQDNEGEGWRIIAQPLETYPGSIVIALPTGSNNGVIGQYRNIGLIFSALLLLISAMAVYWTISRSLRPLKEVERTASAVAAGDISQRLVEHDGETEIARINRSLNSMLGSIEHAMTDRANTLEQMRRFIADASHELRTPLASLRGYAELYRMGALDDKEKLDDAMLRIESEAKRMGGLVENLLALARMEETPKFNKTQVDVAELCRQVIKDAAAANPNVKILLQGAGRADIADQTFIANVDSDSFKQVLVNLLSNASRFASEAETIEVVLSKTDSHLTLDVVDHGEGIPEQLREKVFERFYRADNSRNRETGGNGLGLAIVRALVEGHGGTIKALETTGGGATIRVVVPV